MCRPATTETTNHTPQALCNATPARPVGEPADHGPRLVRALVAAEADYEALRHRHAELGRQIPALQRERADVGRQLAEAKTRRDNAAELLRQNLEPSVYAVELTPGVRNLLLVVSHHGVELTTAVPLPLVRLPGTF